MSEFSQKLCDERHKNIDEKLDLIIKNQELFFKKFEGSNGNPGFTVRIDRLERAAKVFYWVSGLFVARFIWIATQFLYDKVK